MRRAWIIILLLFALPLGLWQALHSERFILAVADWAMNTFTDLRLELRNPRIDLLRGTASADEIHLGPENTEGPALISVLNFSGTTRISDLLGANLANTSLTAKELQIYVSDNDESANPAPMQWLQHLAWLPKELRIDAVHLVTSAETTLVFPLIDVHGERVDTRKYRATAQASYAGEPLLAELLLHATQDEQYFTGIEISGDFIAPQSNSDIDVTGQLRGTEEDFEYDLSVDGRYEDIDAFLRGFRTTAGKIDGSLQIKGEIRGDTDGFILSNASLVLNNMPAYGFEAGAELEYKFNGDNKLYLVAAGEMASLEYLIDWIDRDLTDLGRAQASIEISGSFAQPYIDQFVLSTHQDNGLTINISGSTYVPGKRPQGKSVKDNEIQVDILGPSLAALEPWIGPIDIEPGPWRASGTLTGSPEIIAIDNLIVETGDSDTVALRADGSIENIVGVGRDERLAAITGIDVTVTGHTPDTAHLADLLQVDIPGNHQLDARIEVKGSGDHLQVTGGRIEVLAEGVKVGADIEGALVTPAAENRITGIRSRLELNLDDSSVAERYLEDLKIPEFGPVTASALLVQQGSRFSLQDIRGGTTSGRLDINTRGSVKDLANFSGVALDVDFKGISVAKWLEYVLEDFHFDKPLGHLQGHFTVEDSRDARHISNVLVNTIEKGGPVEMNMRGDILSVTKIPEANFKAEYQIRDPDLLEALVGLRLKPLSVSANAQTQPGKLSLSSRARIGDTHVSMASVIQHDQDGITSLRLALTTPHLYLEDLGLQSRSEGKGEYRPAEQFEMEVEPEGILEQLLHTPPPFPFAVKLKIDGITGDNTDIEGADVHFTGEDGRYTLRKFTLDYSDTIAEIRGMIDLNPQPPATSVGVEVVAVPVSALARDLGLDTDIQGTLSVRGGITGFGDNPEAMKSTLQGRVAVALKDAVIQGAAYDVLATDLLAWIYSGAALETSTQVDCAMALLEFEGGVISTDSLYVETPQMIARGKGKLDIVKEHIDLTVTPMSKSRAIQVPSSVRIRGPLGNPKPIISPVTAVMDVSTEALTLIPRLTLRLFGIKKKSRKKDRPCGAH